MYDRHLQLRHYISTPEPDLLYYASRCDIYCLNTASKKRRHIATIPFEARCTASGYGWICVGGEDDGHFAAIKLDGRTLDVDAALPIENRNRRQSGNDGSGGDVGRRAASVKVERVGEEIVNSISIHRIQDEEAHLDDIVAVLTNNDKTVRVYSLPSSLETTVLDLPFAMNHATVSPDGQTLVAVGDFNQAYFFEREIQDTPPQIHKPHNRLTSASIEWTLTSVVNLHVSEPASTMGYFTTAWSPNSLLVAVGSEGGYITVFDVAVLSNPEFEDEDAVVAIVPGSRPDYASPHPGAVRSMIFSPEPWDLLIWAEDQGRVCIGDLRTGLKSRQVVNLEPKDESLHRVNYEDVPGDDNAIALGLPPPRDIDDVDADILRRYRHASDNATTVNFATEYIEARRRQRERTQENVSGLRAQMDRNAAAAREWRAAMAEDDPQGLTAREQQILESLRTRQREEARALGGGAARSVNYTSGEMFRDSGGGSSRSASGTPNPGESSSSTSARPISETLSAVPDSAFPELARTNATTSRPSSSHGIDNDNTLPPLVSLQESAWSSGSGGQRGSGGGNTGILRLSDGSRLPRRRPSVILNPSTANTNASSTSTSNQNQGGGGREGAGFTAAAAHEAEEENPWRTIEEHVSLARGPLFDNARLRASVSPSPAPLRPTEAELQGELAFERARARNLARQRERWRSLAAESSAHSNTTPSAAASTNTDRTSERLRVAERERERDRETAEFFTRWSQDGRSGAEILLRRSQQNPHTLLPTRGGYSGREIGVRTAGLAMSPDGRTLWVACEEGIFEIGVKVKGRLFWGSVEPR